MEGKVNENALAEFAIGQEGIATSALRPMGKAELKGKLIEVSSLGNFIDAGTPKKIINITSNHILVEPIK
jgi:membrane-bound ClpP family serine protease